MFKRLRLALRVIKGQIAFDQNGLYYHPNVTEEPVTQSCEDKILLLMERDLFGWTFMQCGDNEKHVHAIHEATSIVVCSLRGQFSVDNGKTWSCNNEAIKEGYHNLYKNVAAMKISKHLQTGGVVVEAANSR